MLAIREDIEMEMFDTGVITDAAKAIIYNLLQQDMVALRVTARFAWAIPNPINRQQPIKANRYPFATIKQKATTGGELVMREQPDPRSGPATPEPDPAARAGTGSRFHPPR